MVGGGQVGLHFVLPMFELRARRAENSPAPDVDSLPEEARAALQRVWRKTWLLSMPENAATCDLMPFFIADTDFRDDVPWLGGTFTAADLSSTRPLSDIARHGVGRHRLARRPESGPLTGTDTAVYALIDYVWRLFRKHRGVALPESYWD